MGIYSEHQKAESSFAFDAFGKPLRYSGKRAWTELILNLMFLEPGTYPSSPNMGCGINTRTYTNLEELQGNYKELIESQIREYLSDIPFMGIDIIPYESDSNVVIYVISFSINSDNIDTVAVATRPSSYNNIIDFEIVI